MHFMDISRARSWLDGYNNEDLARRLPGEGQLMLTRLCCDFHQLHGAVMGRYQLHEVLAGLEELVILTGASWIHCFIFSYSE